MSLKLNASGLPEKLKMVQEALRSDWKWAVRFAVLIGVFLALLFPMNARISKFSNDLKRRNHEIELAKQAGLNFLSVPELKQIQARASAFESGYILLSQVASVLDKISAQASAHHLRVIRIHSDSPVSLAGPDGGDVIVKGKKLSRLPIRIRLETNFRNLGEFLKSLSDDDKQAFVIDEMTLEPAPEAAENNLRCDLTISYFSA